MIKTFHLKHHKSDKPRLDNKYYFLPKYTSAEKHGDKNDQIVSILTNFVNVVKQIQRNFIFDLIYYSHPHPEGMQPKLNTLLIALVSIINMYSD